METTTGTTTGTTTPVGKRLLGLARGSRFEGLLYRRGGDGAPLAATDGTALAVLGALDLADAAERLAAASPDGSLPPARQVAEIVRGAMRDLGRDPAGTTVALDTPPDAGLRAAAERALAERLDMARADVRAAEAALERAVGLRRGVTEAQARLRARESEVRAAERAAERLDRSDARAIVVGRATLDLRLVRRALRALGARSGTLHTAGAFDAAALVTHRGVALVMPLRR